MFPTDPGPCDKTLAMAQTGVNPAQTPSPRFNARRPRRKGWGMPLLALATSAAMGPQPLTADLRDVRNSRVSVRVQDGRCTYVGAAEARDGSQWLCRFPVFTQQTRAEWTTVCTTSTLIRGLTAILAHNSAIPRTDSTVHSAGVTVIQPNSRGCGQARSQAHS